MLAIKQSFAGPIYGLLLAGLASIAPDTAQSIGLMPMEKSGHSASDRKGFYLNVLNEGKRSIIVDVEIMPQADGTPQKAVKVQPRRLKIGPKSTRKIILIIGNLETERQREVNVCVSTQKNNSNTLLRICGAYTAHKRN